MKYFVPRVGCQISRRLIYNAKKHLLNFNANPNQNLLPARMNVFANNAAKPTTLEPKFFLTKLTLFEPTSIILVVVYHKYTIFISGVLRV